MMYSGVQLASTERLQVRGTSTEKVSEYASSLPESPTVVRSNRDIANQTQIEQLNGGTGIFRVDGIEKWLYPTPTPPRFVNSFRALQKWEGHVVEVYQETFLARLVPLKGQEPELEAEIYIEELDDEDREILKPGTVFYWSIGYLNGPSGRRRYSVLRIRRLPSWTPEQISEAQSSALQLKSFLDEYK